MLSMPRHILMDCIYCWLSDVVEVCGVVYKGGAAIGRIGYLRNLSVT